MFSFVLRSGFLLLPVFVGLCRVSKPCQILKLKRVLLSASPRVVIVDWKRRSGLGKATPREGLVPVSFVGFCGVSGFAGFCRVAKSCQNLCAESGSQVPSSKGYCFRIFAGSRVLLGFDGF